MKNIYLKCVWALVFILICSLDIASAGESDQASDKNTDDTPVASEVDVYLTRDSSGTVDELVIYNPQTRTLNSLKGSISPSTLESIKQ